MTMLQLVVIAALVAGLYVLISAALTGHFF